VFTGGARESNPGSVTGGSGGMTPPLPPISLFTPDHLLVFTGRQRQYDSPSVPPLSPPSPYSHPTLSCSQAAPGTPILIRPLVEQHHLPPIHTRFSPRVHRRRPGLQSGFDPSLNNIITGPDVPMPPPAPQLVQDTRLARRVYVRNP